MPRQRTELDREVLEALRLEISAQLDAGTWTQSSLARAAKFSQPAINKAARGEAGRDVAEALVEPLGFDSLEAIVAKHRTAVTANDVAVFLNTYKGLAETLREDPRRWELGTLTKVIVEARRNPPHSRPDGHLIAGHWRDVLDAAAADSARSRRDRQ